ncbi:hypothetical protein LSM04_008176 [Trypanosoma melophagium]|uniref:uncharacterized protein n=1 Tax=Trypanosoma melophagium TaxID=715481 RepID=UPI003519F6CB|nr:hypothetical protein LSM04_008176 [Trypanosoma melophagium]
MSSEAEFDVSRLELRLEELQAIWHAAKENSSYVPSAQRRSSLHSTSSRSPNKKRSQSQEIHTATNTPRFLLHATVAERRRNSIQPRGSEHREPNLRRTIAIGSRDIASRPSSRSPSRSPLPISLQRVWRRETKYPNSDKSSSSGILPPLESSFGRLQHHQQQRMCRSCGFSGLRPTANFCQNCGTRL